MARRSDGRRWIVRGLLIGLAAASGCHSTQMSRWPGNGDRPGPMRDVDTRQDVGALGRLHEWLAGQKPGRLDPSQLQ